MRALVVPVVLLVVLVAGLVLLDPAARFETAAPPVEDLVVERTTLRPGEIVLLVRNAGPDDNTIAQVLVDDAYWHFTAEPGPTIARYGTATVTLQYPWVEGEAHAILILTPSGTPFEHEIPVAVASPEPDARSIVDYALIGILVGVVPVVVGMTFFTTLRTAATKHTNAVLAFTLGVLAYLAIDTIVEGLELADELPAAFHGIALFVGAALVAMLLVLALERALRARGLGATALAVLIALGIGLHNLGEGLLIGTAFALGSITLGSALILGFALHNVTEGPAIVSPLARTATGVTGTGLPWQRFVALAAIAGLPTVAGAWMGAFASSSLLAAIFFGLGSGAILVVLVQVGGAMRRDEGGLWTATNLVAFGIGFALMLATAYLVG